MPIQFLNEPEVDAPATVKFLDEPEVDPTPEQVKQRMADPHYTPTYGDIAILDQAENLQPLGAKAVGMGEAALTGAKNVIGDIWTKGKGAVKELAKVPDIYQVGATGLEAGARGTMDLANLIYRGERRLVDSLTPGDPVAQRLARELENRQYSSMRSDVAEGKAAPFLMPTDTGKPWVSPELQKTFPQYKDWQPIQKDSAELGSYVAQPPVLGVAGKVFGRAGKAATVAKAGEGVVSHAAEKVADAAGKVADVATIPGKFIKRTVDATLPETGAGSVAAATPTAIGATVAVPARIVEKGAEAVQQLGRTVGDSSASRLTQIAMSESAPQWVRGAARNLSRVGVDKAGALAADTAKSAAHGAAVMGALAAPSAENTEEFGGALGTGAAFGGLAHLAMSPATHGARYRAAQDADIVRWYDGKTPEEQGAINGMDLNRDQALKLLTAETIANGFIDPNANVRFVYQDGPTFEATHGVQRGVAFVQGDKPTIIFNTAKMKTGTAYHELFHTISRSPDIIDYGALTTKLMGVHDEAGNVLKPGLLGTTDLAKIGDQYFSRLDPIGQKSVADEKAAFDLNPSSPQAAPWVKRIVNEIGAELFSNLARDTKGSLLDAVDKPTLMLVDAMTQGDRAKWVQNLGAKLQKVLGAAPTVESDIFPGLKSSPELQGMMRDYVRAKRDLTKTPEFGDEFADPSVIVNPRDALRTGGDEIVKKFPDNDNFAKDATGAVAYAGGRPILLTEGEIKKVQTNRAEAMSKALESVPDTGEAGVMRQQNAPAAPTAAPLPPGAVPATPAAPKASKKAPASFVGRWFSDAQMAALNALPDNTLTPSMKAKLQSLNDMVKKGDGSPILLFYNAALKSRRYSSAIRETARVLTPISMSITKAGNFVLTGLDITAFNSKLNRWMNDKPAAFADFNNSADVFVQKTQQYLDNHQKSLPGATGLDADAAKTQRMAYRINDFINIRDVASAARNPDRLSNTSDKDGLIRSFRFDRMNRIEPANGDKFPINYELQKQVFSPDSDNFKAWFGDSKVVDEQGQPKLVYHGTQRLDRIGNTLRKNRATSGPMPYFTESAEIASNYAKSKVDTSYDGPHDPQLYVNTKPADRAWYDLSPEQQADLAAKLPYIVERGYKEGKDDSTLIIDPAGGYAPKDVWDRAVRQARGNWLAAAKDVLMDSGLFFGDEERAANILKFAGLDARIEDPNMSQAGVLPVYLSVKNPLDTYNIPASVITALEAAAKRQRAQPEGGYSAGWDKKLQHPQAWVEGLKRDIASGTLYTWTVIPDWATKTLKSLGYDGIHDTGGKHGGAYHDVWIPFEPTQAKSPYNRGSFSPKSRNMLYSPDTAEMTPIGVKDEKNVVDNQANPDMLTGMKSVPSEDIRAQAAEYNKQAGIKSSPHQTAAPVREDLGKRLADAFDTAKHEPTNPEVVKAYNALAAETKAQWDFITGKGVKMEPWTKEGQPYKNSAEMTADVRSNKHLWFFPTDQGFGSDGKAVEHPMLTPTDVVVNGKKLVINDLFRAVHDYFGHAKEGFEFGPKGEYNAYLAHNQMFSEGARPALAAETLAQNSWVNYGKHLRRPDGSIPVKGDKDFVPLTERPYADQKAALMPSELVAEANQIAPKELVDKPAKMEFTDDVIKGAKRALSILAADGKGATLNLATGRNMAKRKAFAVSIFPDRSKVLDRMPTRADLETFIDENKDLLSQPENALGIWNDKSSGKVYVDVSVAVEDPAFAKYLGKKYNQKAIWDFQKGAEVPTGGTGDAIEAMAPAHDRIPLAKEEFKSLGSGDDLFAAEKENFVTEKVRDLSMIQDSPEGQNLSKLERAAVELGKKTLRDRVQLIPSTEAKVRARRALQQGVPEVIDYLAKAKNENFDAGNDWYRNDISKMEETTREIFPETKTHEKMVLFKALLASLSGGQTPKDNYRVASEAFAAYLETGKFSHESLWRQSEDGQAKQLGRNAKTAAEKFEFYREHFKGDEKALADYLLNIQPKLLIADPKSNKVQAENNYGAYDLGPKFGAFFLNLNGLSSAVTVDIWATRTWNRWMGTPLRRVDDGSKRGRYELPDAPTEAERPVIQDSFKQIAAEVAAQLGEKVDPMDVQAVLWFYEKDLFAKLGVRVDRGSFSKSAEDYKANPIHKLQKGALRPERDQLRMELK